MPTTVAFEAKLDAHRLSLETIKPSRLHRLYLGTRILTPSTAGQVLFKGSGRGHAEPLRIAREFDHASFHFFSMKEGKGSIPELVIKISKENGAAAPQLFCTITTWDAIVMSYGRTIGLPTSGTGLATFGTGLEEIRLSFRTIECTWIQQSVTAADDWESQT